MKKVAIIGSCVSRDIFNDTRLNKIFQVDFYAFQNNIWDLFNKSLDVPKVCIDAIPLENFTRRMIDYDLNKTTIPTLETKPCDFLMIDMFVIWRECLRIKSKDATIYFKANRVRALSEYIKKANKDFECDILEYKDVDENLIYNGLTDLANWINKHYKPEQVILHYPIFCKRYWNLDNKLLNYSERDRNNAVTRYGIVKKYTDFLASMIPGCKQLIPEEYNSNACALYLATDDITGLPNPVHCSPKDLIISATKLMELIGEENKQSLINAMNDEMIIEHNKNVKLAKVIDRTNKNTVTSLNNYINNILDLENQIVLIATKNQASEFLHKFFSKTKLDLNMKIERCQSYVAVIDRQNKLISEDVSDEKVEIRHKNNRREIQVISNYKENISSIKVNGVEYSPNRRGLNFVIVNNKTYEVEDSFFCDTYADAYLLISPTKTRR